jgi:hypothetical protein
MENNEERRVQQLYGAGKPINQETKQSQVTHFVSVV